MAGLALSVTQFHDFEPSSVMLLMARCAMHGIVFGPSTAKSRSCDHDEIGGLTLMGFPGSSPGHVRGVGMEGELAIRSANCIVALKAEPSVRDGSMLCRNGMKRRYPCRGQGFVAVAFRTLRLEKGVIRREVACAQHRGGFAIITG